MECICTWRSGVVNCCFAPARDRSLQSTDLASLDEVPLEKLASVHTLDISRNRLLTLKQLSRLPFLSSLNASHNGLTAVLGELGNAAETLWLAPLQAMRQECCHAVPLVWSHIAHFLFSSRL